MCGGTSGWSKAALAVIVLAFILHVIGFATITWSKYEINTARTRIGLWEYETCVGDTCATNDITDDLTDSNFTATQVMEVFALILLIFAMVLTLLYLIIDSFKNNCMAWVAIALCFSASFFGFIGMITWLGYVEDPYVIGFSFALTILAAILALIAGFLLFPDVIDRSNKQQHWGQY